MSKPVTSFFRRYWWILLVIAATIYAMFSPTAFRLFDLLVYLPAAFAITFGLPLLWRNVFHSKTTDDDVDSGHYAKSYQSLEERDRVWLVTIQWVCYVIASAIIVGGFLVFLSGIPPRI